MSTQTTPMSVQQLHQALGEAIDHGQGDAVVKIPYDPGHATLGPQPSVALKAAGQGIDWDMGTYFLHPQVRLGVPDKDLRKRLKDVETLVGRMHLVVLGARGGTDAERYAKLQEIIPKLDELLAGRGVATAE